MTHSEINQAILSRQLHTGNDESTYYNLYDFACDNYEDPHLLFKIAIYGYYQPLYKWTRQQAADYIELHKENSVKWTDGVQEYYYDWGKGKNKVTEDYLHVPNLDHIDPHSLSKDNRPENFRVRCRRLNENKGNTSTDTERRATIVDMFKDMDRTNQLDTLTYLQSLIK